MKLRYFFLLVALACPATGSTMGLLPQDKDKAVWEFLQRKVLKRLGGGCEPVTQPADGVMAAATADAARHELPVNKVVSAKLHAMDKVKFALVPEKKQGRPRDGGGLFALTPSVTGTYVLGTVSRAWIDVVDQERNRFATAKPYQWVDLCGRRMKAGVFELRAGVRYRIQISVSPDPVLDLFCRGPAELTISRQGIDDRAAGSSAAFRTFRDQPLQRLLNSRQVGDFVLDHGELLFREPFSLFTVFTIGKA